MWDSSTLDKFNALYRTKHNTHEYYESIVYPNPVKNILYFTLGQKYNPDINVYAMVTNLQGRVVKEKKIGFLKGDIISLDFGDLANGVYIFTIKQDSVLEHFKIIKE